MWRILKAEICYDRLRVFVFFIVCAVVFLTIWFGVKWERNRVPMTLLMILILTLTAVYAGEKNRLIQKRDRLHVLLPATLWQIGITHLLYPIIVLLCIYLVLFLSALVVQAFVRDSLTMPSHLHILTLTGLVLIVNAVILLHRDLRMTFTKKYQRFFVLVSGLFRSTLAFLCDNRLFRPVRREHACPKIPHRTAGISCRIPP